MSSASAFCCNLAFLGKGSIPHLCVMLCPVVCVTNEKYLPLRAEMEGRKANQALSATCCKPCTLPAVLLIYSHGSV